IITDMQALPWSSFGDGEGTEEKEEKKEDAEEEEPDAAAMNLWDPSKFDKRTSVFVSLLGAKAPENMAPSDVELQPSIIMAGAHSKATVRLNYAGPPGSTAVTLFLNDEEIATRSISIGDGFANDLSFLLPPMEAGRYAARVELPDDNLQLDNTFHFIFKAEAQFPTLCVGTRDDTLFIRAALTAALGGKAAIEAEWVEPDLIEADKLKNYACIFLCNALPLAAGELAAMEKFVSAGGLLIVFPGERSSIQDYQSWNCFPGLPSARQDVMIGNRSQILHWDAPQHPILQPLKIGVAAPSLAIRTHLEWKEFDARAERLISSGDGRPFLVGRPFGRGYVLMFAIAPDRSWSDFPLSPFYLPIIHQIVQFGAGVGSYSHYVWCTDTLPLEPYLPEATTDTTLQNPGGENRPIRSAVVDGEVILNVEELDEAGIYLMQDPSAGEPVPAIAVNMDRSESDLSPIDPDKLKKRIDIDRVHISTSQEELMAQLQEHRVGRTFNEQLFWFALILAVIEFFYANRLMKSAPTLSESLTVDTSGKVLEKRPGSMKEAA
ncbi:MAG: hypothetical protein AAF492_07315, partial [Verrucomicrobiota bacterium]